ncbi:MAG: hypothetical protein BroJett018_39780 [Chloroflexota bacterium]|nr:MAG: hypothetical protein BroJett018_39780 [Chloroflexota bacterium]
MARVLRIGAGVMGVLLVVMTAGLWIRRATTEPEYGMLFRRSNNALILRIPDLNYTRQVLSVNGTLFGGSIVTQNRSILLTEKEIDNEVSTLFWLNLDSFERKNILRARIWNAPSLVIPSPGEKWLGYTDYTEHYHFTCRLLNLQTAENLDLSDVLHVSQNTFCLEFSEDNRWVYVVAEGELPNVEISYRIRLMDKFVENLSERFGDVKVFPWSLDQPQIIGSIGGRLYRTDPTDIQWQPIINASPTELLTDNYYESFWALLPNEQLMVISTSLDSKVQRTMGIPLQGGSPRWSVEMNLKYLLYSDYPNRLFFWDENSVYRMHPNGTNLELIAKLQPGNTLLWVSRLDDQYGTEWLYFQSAQDILWRINLADLQQEAVAQGPNLTLVQWSPDRRWMLLRTMPYADSYSYLRARLDGTERQVVFESRYNFFDWSLSPTKPSQPLLLISIGIGLIGSSVFGKRPYHFIRQRRRPAA